MLDENMERTTVPYVNLSEKWAKKVEDFNKQFYRIYIVRLDKMTEYLMEEIQKKWKGEYPVCKLYRLSEENYDKCVVIGTLFKDQKLKPSVLKQLAESNSLVPQPIVAHRTDDSDTLHIEDELQRFELVINSEEQELNPKYLVTGVTCALLGSSTAQGKFEVEDYVFAGYREQIERPLGENENFVVITSGLDLINIHKYSLKLRLFIDWISGYFGEINNVDPTKITRILIAGNSTRKNNENTFQKFTMTTRTNNSLDTVDAVKTLDAFLLELCQMVEVDIMPGQNDPSNHMLPQKALHHCLFPKSVYYKSLNRVTNPYECEISNTRFLGTSGQPICDILRYSEILEPVEALENCLKWGHLAPTAPDTLACFPYYDKDPFIIENCPQVFFAGNQPKFDTKLVFGRDGQKVRIISIPEFATTSSVCVLNLKTLECSEMVFS